MSKASLVIFDIDGTLIDTRTFILESYIHVAKQLGNITYTQDRLPHYLTSGTLNQTYSAFLPHVELTDAMSEHEAFQKQNLDLIRPYEGAQQLLEVLSKTHAIAALTNRRSTSAHTNMKRMHIHEYFDLILTADDVANHKPHPEGVLYSMRHLGASADTTTMVGDSAADIDAGRAANTNTIGVTHGFSSVNQMEEIAPNHIIHSLSELPPLVTTSSA